MFIWFSFKSSWECLTVSKALLKSSAITLTDWWELSKSVTMCRKLIRATVVEPVGRKANWLLLLSYAVSSRQPWDSSLYLAAVSPSTLNWKILGLSAGPTAWKSWAGLSMGLSVCGESGFIGLWNSTLLVESFVSPRLATGYSQGTRMTDCHERWFSVLHVSRLLRHEWFSVGLFLISRIPRGKILKINYANTLQRIQYKM